MAQLADGRARWSQCRLFFANLETKVRLDGTGGALGTSFDFEQDLGLDDTKTRIMAEGYWRFFKRHRLDVSYFNLDRSGDGSSTIQIRFGDEVFQASLPLQVFLDIEVFNLGYSYSILFDEKKELAVGLALSIQDSGFFDLFPGHRAGPATGG